MSSLQRYPVTELEKSQAREGLFQETSFLWRCPYRSESAGGSLLIQKDVTETTQCPDFSPARVPCKLWYLRDWLQGIGLSSSSSSAHTEIQFGKGRMWLPISLTSASKQKEAGSVCLCVHTCVHTCKANKNPYEEAMKNSRQVSKTREAEADLDQMSKYYEIWILSESGPWIRPAIIRRIPKHFGISGAHNCPLANYSFKACLSLIIIY